MGEPAIAGSLPYNSSPRYLIFDRGANFSDEVIETIKSFGIEPKRTGFQSPWQNGVAERFVGSCRRDLLDHVIVLNERHLKRPMTEYVGYYHVDRTHLGLVKGTPAGRKAEVNSTARCEVVAMPRLGGLHHRYKTRRTVSISTSLIAAQRAEGIVCLLLPASHLVSTLALSDRRLREREFQDSLASRLQATTSLR